MKNAVENENLNIMINMLDLRTGGAERFVANYANWLVSNTKCNINLVVTEKLNTIYELNPKIKVHEGNLYGRGLNKLKKRIFYHNKIKEIKPDIIFNLFSNTALYTLLAFSKNSALIYSERCNLKERSYLKKLFSLICVKFSDGIVFQTERSKKQYPNWIDKKLTTVIHNPISNHAIVQSKKTVKKERIITAMGRLSFQKGFDVLIKAFKGVSEKYPEYKLIIYGEGTLRGEYENLIKELHLEDKVLLPGIQKDGIEMVAKSDVFVLSSRFEGMPNVLLEAMCVKTACVATDCETGPSELINNYENGLLAKVDDVDDLRNKILELLENDELRHKIENNCGKIIDTHSPDDIFEQYYEFMLNTYYENKNKVHTTVIGRKMFNLARRFHLLNGLSDAKFNKLLFRYRVGKKLDLNNPQTFNEKIQWLKTFDQNPLYVKMVDKYEAKEYVASIIGKEYIIPTIGIYDNFDEIDFDSLPNQFAMKCTHNSGGEFICTDKTKIDKEKLREQFTKNLNINYYWNSREWPYKNIKPRIIIEKYMVDESKKELKDYKIFCFNGEPKLIQVDFNRFVNHQRNIYDINWNLQNFGIKYPTNFDKKIEKPQNLDKMLEIAKVLSKDMAHLRVDLYVINDKIYFGELTFYHGSGTEKFTPEIWNKIMGDYIKLKNQNH